MDIFFENEYTMESKLFKEYVYNVLCKKTIVTGIIIGLLGILFSYFIPSQNAYIILTVAIITLVASILTPVVTARGLEDASKRLNNGNVEKTNVKFSNNIVMNEGKAHLEFEYNQITKIVQTKSFIVLQTSKQSAILVLKNGFLKGNENDFIKFIEGK